MPQRPPIHAYTHLPDGSDPLTLPAGSSNVVLRAVLYSSVSIGSGSEFELIFDEWENEDTSVFGETLSGGKLWKVSLKEQGVYSVALTAQWSTNFDAHHGMLILDDSNASSEGYAPINFGGYNSRFDSDSFTYPPVASITRKWPRYGVASGDVIAGAYGRLLCKAIQNSGSSKTLSNAAFEVIYHGASLSSI